MTGNPQPSHRNISRSRWSMVTQHTIAAPQDPRSALVELCMHYWYPVYAYVRRCGHAPDIAQDIARGFLQNLFVHFRDDAAALAQARFRAYLLACLNAFLADDWRRTPDGEMASELRHAPNNLELRYQRDNIQAQSPEAAYQRSFALEMLSRATHRLRAEARQTGHLPMYEALHKFLAVEPLAGQYEELARELGRRPLALVVALKRLRQRLRELIGEELADTVSSHDELDAEMKVLHSILREQAR
ncbi:MAG: hypothetical protein IPK54_08090 [Dokdonella sp.]|uniref:RNA polymerase sigma factor n=1 Tax=Dokdonella sp. TaxID=2291710 RepID=UPI0025BCD08D|nr:hypothetical protein [Dokdonella sp.]MBK8123498.1 hypothetical protein [Dokdonella sp.]